MRPARLPRAAGARVRFGARRSGTRAALAVRGGFDVPQTLGSRATSLVSRMGPFGGRALAAGDVLPIGPRPAGWRRPAGRAMTLPAGGARLRVLLGPHDAMFTRRGARNAARLALHDHPAIQPHGISPRGPRSCTPGPADILSDATPVGSLQVPASGQPILLMADRQTTEGIRRLQR